MHEASIAQAIIEALEEECQKHPGSHLQRVKLRIGMATGVMIDSLVFAFEAAKVGTVASRATLEIEEVPFKGRCNHCKLEFFSEDGIFLICPNCDSAFVETISGRELEISELELEEENEGQGS